MKQLISFGMSCLLAVGPVSFASAEAAQKTAEKEVDPHKADKDRLERLTLENNIKAQERKLETRERFDELESLRLEYDKRTEERKKSGFDLEAEYKELSTEQLLYNIKHAKELRALTREKEELSLRYAVATERQKAALAEIDAENNKLSSEYRLNETRNKLKMAGVTQELAELKTNNDIERAKVQLLEVKFLAEKNEIDLELKRLALRSQQMKFEQELRNNEIAMLKSDISMRSEKEAWKAEANRDPSYEESPFIAGRLTISDRRIRLNGPIFRGVADYITERIHFYNNESDTKPIFLVIDSSPGGSVMEGYRIVKAIDASKAPVHVIVKSYAASMAAAITTLAKESYAYPNAVILHHEMSTLTWGNMTQLKEQLELAREWEARLMGPVAKKTGMSIESFRKNMYAHNSDGDWEEFGDTAQKLQWVKHIVHEIRETGITKRPDAAEELKRKSAWPFGFEEKVDLEGKHYVSLPRLNPFDMYYIHNPDRYYR